ARRRAPHGLRAHHAHVACVREPARGAARAQHRTRAGAGGGGEPRRSDPALEQRLVHSQPGPGAVRLRHARGNSVPGARSRDHPRRGTRVRIRPGRLDPPGRGALVSRRVGIGSSSRRDGAVMPVSAEDLAVITEQLGREARGVVDVAARCVCGRPAVVKTLPRLPNGTPFPTTFYLTHPRAVSSVGTLEASGLMREMTARLGEDEELAAAYQRAHEDYLARREELGQVEEIARISAGGMPTRVKCLHVLVAHSLAVGPGINPLGDEALARLKPLWDPAVCTC